jgi:endonuclease YncB( thermonuclease family)
MSAANRPAWCLSLARLSLLLLLMVLAQVAAAAEITGRVVGITDGDTLIVLGALQQQTKVRLAEIDAPEAHQPYGARAKRTLSDLVFGKSVRIVEQGTDRYGRTIGHVYAGSVDVNAEMIRQGAAWVYRQYNRDASLLHIEQEAREAHRGLWALPEAQRMPPWEWRAAERGRQSHAATPFSAPAASGPAAGGFTCDAKRYCREMTNCAEARFYLSQCGLSRLDGDGDGIPCERLCR